MCSSFTWGTVSVHYLLGLPLAYALRSATPNGLMLFPYHTLRWHTLPVGRVCPARALRAGGLL